MHLLQELIRWLSNKRNLKYSYKKIKRKRSKVQIKLRIKKKMKMLDSGNRLSLISQLLEIRTRQIQTMT
jgi:hypothetical protein